MKRDLLTQMTEIVKCKDWKFLPGMRIGGSNRLGILDPDLSGAWSWTRLGADSEADGMGVSQVGKSALPDLRDGPTLRAALDHLKNTIGVPGLFFMVNHESRWLAQSMISPVGFYGTADTESELLLSLFQHAHNGEIY